MTGSTRSPYNNQNISFKLLHHFAVICDASSITRASHQLNVCQSNLTLQMQDLERRMGVTLINRSPRGVELTDAGRIFLPEVKALLRRFDKVKELVRNANSAGRVEVVCASFSVPDYPVVPNAIRGLRSKDPRVDVKLVELPSSAQPDALEAGRIQVAVMLGKLPNFPFKLARIQSSELALLTCTGHPLPGAVRTVPLNNLTEETFWMVERTAEPVLHKTVTRALLKAGIASSSIRTAKSIDELVSQVAAGRGVALIPQCLRGLDSSGVLSYVQIEAAPAIDVVIAHKSLTHNAGAKHLVGSILESGASLAAALSA